MNFMEYISNDINKQRIKAIGNNLYKFMELFEKVFKATSKISSFKDIEKLIFNNYILIIIFEIIPEKLIKFLGIENKNDLNINIINIEKKNINSNISEKELFIILSLYEIKEIPLIPVKKYIQKFYNKILNVYKNYEKLNIPKISFKKEFDIKFKEKFLYLIKEKTEDFIKNINYPRFSNFSLILQIEYLPNSKIDKEIYQTIDNNILDLIINENIAPFYKNNEDDQFFKNIKNIDYESNYIKKK